MKQNRAWFTAAVSTAIAGTVLLGASPASAHTYRAWVSQQDGTQLGFAEVYGSNHEWLAACDTRADGIGVYAAGILIPGGAHMHVNDDNGSASGCGRAKAPTGYSFYRIMAVSRDGNDSGWRDV
jgi:hypothetical protein